MHFSTKKQFRFFYVSLFLFVVFFSFSAHAASGVPSTISYQGKLTDSGGNALGGAGTSYYFKFSFWDNATVGSGTKLWPSSSPTSLPLTVRQGVFNVDIGGAGYPDTLNYNFNTNSQIYLQVEISSDNVTFETLSPRSSITSSAFSQVASQVSGTNDSSFGTTTPIANSLISAISTAISKTVLTIKGFAGQVANLFNILDSNNSSLFTVTAGGNVGVGTSTPANKLDVWGNLNVGTSSTPLLFANTATGKIGIGTNSPAYGVDIAQGNAVNFQGINNYIQFNDANWQIRGRDSSPNFTRAIVGTYSMNMITGAGLGEGFAFGRSGGNSIVEIVNDGRFYLNGLMGIGTTSPIAKLSVVGTSGSTTPLFIIASSTNASLFQVNSNGNVAINTNDPVLSITDSDGTNRNASITFTTGGGTWYESAGVATGNTNNNFNLSRDLINPIFSVTRDSPQLAMATGTAASPAYSFQSSGIYGLSHGWQNGMFYPSADNLAFSTNGTEKLRIDSSGYVGIGTTSPSNRLEVVGDTYLSGNLTATGTLLISNPSASQVVVKSGSSQGSTPQYSIQDSSGTTQFGYYYGQGSITAYPNIRFDGANMILNSKNSGNVFLNRDETTSNYTFLQGGGMRIGSALGLSWANATDPFMATLDVGLFRGSAGKLYVGNGTAGDSTGTLIAGNVGIGTTTPVAQLDVGGQAGLILPFSSGVNVPVVAISGNTNTTSGVQMTNVNTGTSADFRFAIGDTTGNYITVSEPSINNNVGNIFGISRNIGSFIFNNGGTTRNLGIGTFGANDLILGTNNTDRVHILSTGNVGIGTTTPGSKLTVVGNIDIGTTTTSSAGQLTQNGTRLLHTYGSENTFLGIASGNFTTTGSGNTGIGTNSLSSLGVGASFNVGIGRGSGQGITTGSSNLLLGNGAGVGITTESYNTIIGDAAGYSSTGLNGVVYIGRGAGRQINTFTDSVFLGTVAGGTTDGGLQTVSGLTNVIALGARSYVGASNTMVLGSVGAYAVDIASGISTASAKLHLVKTTEQLRLGYDTSNYLSTTVGSTGSATFNAVGTSPSFNFTGGNVGIGTTSPVAKLDIWGNLNVGTSSTPAFFVNTANSFVGIGTNAPSNMFNIENGVNGSNATMAAYIHGGNSGNDFLKLERTVGASYFMSFGGGGGAGNARIAFGISGSTYDWSLGDNTDFVISNGAVLTTAPKFVIQNSTGFIGVGTSSPVAKLDIWGNLNVGTSSLPAFFVNSATSNVGVGTSTPWARFTVNGLIAGDYFAMSTTTATSTVAGSFDVGSGSLKYDTNTGITSIQNANIGSFSFDSDAGQVSWADMPVTSNSASGTIESYTAQLGGNPMLTIYGESDGVGGIQNQRIGIGTTTPQYPFIVANANGAYLTTGGSWTNGSSRDYKENFTKIDGNLVLDKIGKLDIEQWNYINESTSTTHIGPIAEDFFGAFGLGGDDKHISTIDPAGVALRGIQALLEKFNTLVDHIDSGVAYLKDIVVSHLTIGSSSKPEGITIYDSATGAPYCMRVTYGQQQTLAGTCESLSGNVSNGGGSSGGGSSAGSGGGSTPVVDMPAVDTGTSTATSSDISAPVDVGTTTPVDTTTATGTPPIN